MPAAARKLASFLGLLIEAATGAPAARAHDTNWIEAERLQGVQG